MAGSNPDEGPRTSSQKSKSGKKKEGSIGKKSKLFHDILFLKQFCYVVD